LFGHPVTQNWLVIMRNDRKSASACWKTGMLPLKYMTTPAFFDTASSGVICVTPAGKIGNCG
jgi:hypothetical protein